MILELSTKMWSEIGTGIYETIKMTLLSTAIGYLIGLPMGVIYHNLWLLSFVKYIK